MNGIILLTYIIILLQYLYVSFLLIFKFKMNQRWGRLSTTNTTTQITSARLTHKKGAKTAIQDDGKRQKGGTSATRRSMVVTMGESADLTHLSQRYGLKSPKSCGVNQTAALMTRDKNAQKHIPSFLDKYYSPVEQTLIFTNESFAVPSKFSALMEIIQRASSDLGGYSDLHCRTIGFWGCNLSNSKLIEVLSYMKGTLNALEISEGKAELKKSGLKAIAECFQSTDQDAVTKKENMRLLIQRTSVSTKALDHLFHLVTGSQLTELSLISTTSYFQPKDPQTALTTLPTLLARTPALRSLTLHNLDLGTDQCFHIAQGLVMNGGHLRSLNLNQNRIGTKGVQLICEAMRDNQMVESLFLNGNGIDTDGAYALSKVLVSSSLRELHVAENKIASCGLAVMMESIAKHNKKLKFLDIAYNVIDIGILRALRQMLEKNTTLNYLSISGLHKFNQRAIHSLQESLSLNSGLKLIDLKRTTRPFLFAMDHGANLLRLEGRRPKLIFLHDSVFLSSQNVQSSKSKLSKELARDVHETTFGHPESSIESSKRGRRTLSSTKNTKVVKSRTPEQPLQQSYVGRAAGGGDRKYQPEYRMDAIARRSDHQMELSALDDHQDDIKINIQTNHLQAPSIQEAFPRSHSVDNTMNSGRSSQRDASFAHAPISGSLDFPKMAYYGNFQGDYQEPTSLTLDQSLNFKEEGPHQGSLADKGSNFGYRASKHQDTTSIYGGNSSNGGNSKSPSRRVQFSADIRVYKKAAKKTSTQIGTVATSEKSKKSLKVKRKSHERQPSQNSALSHSTSRERSNSSQGKVKVKGKKKKSIQDSIESAYNHNPNTSIQSADIYNKRGILKGGSTLSQHSSAIHTQQNLHSEMVLKSKDQNQQMVPTQSNYSSMNFIGAPPNFKQLTSQAISPINMSVTNYQSNGRNLPEFKTAQPLKGGGDFGSHKPGALGVSAQMNMSYHSTLSNLQDSTLVLSPSEKENLRYNMKDDKVVVFYKKILGEIRDVIREERQGIKKYLK